MEGLAQSRHVFDKGWIEVWGEEIPECFPEGGGLDLGIELDLSSLRRESCWGDLHCLAKVFSLGYFSRVPRSEASSF